jgi:hypothetical protein
MADDINLKPPKYTPPLNHNNVKDIPDLDTIKNKQNVESEMITENIPLPPLKPAKSWRFPFLVCACNPHEETPDNIISKICLHQNCREKMVFCNECVGKDLHDKLHSSHILKLKEFFERCLNISALYKEEHPDNNIMNNNNNNPVNPVNPNDEALNNSNNSNNTDNQVPQQQLPPVQQIDMDEKKHHDTELSPEIMKLYKEKNESTDYYKEVINSEINKVEQVFTNILDEITKLFNERKWKLINHLNKTFETYAYSYEMFNAKIEEYTKNNQLLRENSVKMSQDYVSSQLATVKTGDDMKDLIQRVNLQINQIQSVNKENLENLNKFATVLKKFQQTKPELKALNLIKNSKFEHLESLEIRSPLFFAQRKLNFTNTSEFQRLCAEILHFTSVFKHEIGQHIQNALAEYECFILENKKSEDFAVAVQNYYIPNFNKPFLHYFHPNSKDLFLLNLPLYNSISTPEDCIFHKVSLDIPFNIPSNHTSVSTPDGRLFLNGGKGSLDKLYEMNFEERKLVPKRSMKQKRWDHAICYSKGFIFVFGGADRDENYKLTKKCDKYDIVLDNWTEIASFSSEASDFSVCSFNDKYIYKFGGWNSISYINVIERYDIEFDHWSIVNPPLKPLLGGFPECVQINERQIYVFGGFFVKGHDENFILEIDENEQNAASAGSNAACASHNNGGPETIKFANKVPFPVRSQFKMAKSVLVHNGVVYCIHKNKEQTSLLSFDGKNWKILNDNLYKNYEIQE